MRLGMTFKRYARLFLLALLLGAAFALLPTKADHGELFGIGAALAAHAGGGNGRSGGMGHEATASGNVGANAGAEASHGVELDPTHDQPKCDFVSCG
jgi:hypothetical protein